MSEALLETPIPADLQPMMSEAEIEVKAEVEPGPDTTPTPIPAAAHDPHSTLLMENAILAEGEAGDDRLPDATMLDAQHALDRPWSEVSADAKKNTGARIGADLRIVSVGTACRAGERAVQLPLVFGNDEGETVTLALTIQLDPLLDDEMT